MQSKSRKRNLTLVVEDDLLIRARKLAIERHTTVNQMVRDYLHQLVQKSDRRRVAGIHLKAAFSKGIIVVGSKGWTRDSLYER